VADVQYVRIKCAPVSIAAPARRLALPRVDTTDNKSAAKGFAAGLRTAHSSLAGRSYSRKKCSEVITLVPSLTASGFSGFRLLARSR
jgi:hypothetical protein